MPANALTPHPAHLNRQIQYGTFCLTLSLRHPLPLQQGRETFQGGGRQRPFSVDERTEGTIFFQREPGGHVASSMSRKTGGVRAVIFRFRVWIY